MWITWFHRLTSPDLLNSEYFIAVIAQLPYSCEQVYFEVISLKHTWDLPNEMQNSGYGDGFSCTFPLLTLA